ncbi:hypothetical protein SDC9_63110 [bioreactor metagenome]|uniref:Uncharacterized protein n=1 Tax=bioreactor metagenome TaxID=1076179 RepID=A0A644XKW0_9ZZZZ
MKHFIEIFYSAVPLTFTFSNCVKIFFNVRGEMVIHNFRKKLHQEVIHHRAYIGGHQFIFIGSCRFLFIGILYFSVFQGKDVVQPFYTVHGFLFNILTILNG